jgi:hypothetical protein
MDIPPDLERNLKKLLLRKTEIIGFAFACNFTIDFLRQNGKRKKWHLNCLK